MAEQDHGGEAVCNLCGFPAVRIEGRWAHAEPADAVFCSIFNGTGLIIEEDENAEEDHQADR